MSGFRYERPSTIAEAASLLAEVPGQARVLAGGTDLLVALRAGTARPELVVDVKRIPGLADITWTAGGDLVLGACVPVERVAEDARIRDVFPALAEGALAIGSVQIRARATVGGNLVNASPCMDTAPPLLVLGARLAAVSRRGEREIPLAEFFRGVKLTALGEGELVTAVRVPRPPAGLATAFDKIKRVFGHDLALVNAAAAFDPGARTLRAAFGSCGATPVLTPALAGIEATTDPAAAGERLAALALEHICPIDDVRASAEYRRDMAAALSRRLAARVLAAARRAR